MIGLVLAQAVAAATPAQAVTSDPPAFFAAQQPGNAREMLERLPGFSIDFGTGARGFEGTGGNVLIDGQRPPTNLSTRDTDFGRNYFVRVRETFGR